MGTFTRQTMDTRHVGHSKVYILPILAIVVVPLNVPKSLRLAFIVLPNPKSKPGKVLRSLRLKIGPPLLDRPGGFFWRNQLNI